MLDADGLQPSSVTFVCPLREVFFLLYGRLGEYDLDPEYTFSFLGMLVDDVVREEQSRPPVGGCSNFEEIVSEMQCQGMSADDAKQLCYAAAELIIQLVTQYVPNLGSPLYKDAYQYYLSPSYDLYLSIHRSVFERGPPAGIPPAGLRAYRL